MSKSEAVNIFLMALKPKRRSKNDKDYTLNIHIYKVCTISNFLEDLLDTENNKLFID